VGQPDLGLASLIRAYGLRAPDKVGRSLHEQLVTLSENDPQLALHLADTEYRKSRFEGTIEWAERVLTVAPDHGAALFLRGSSHARMRRPEVGVEDLRRAVEALPDSHEVQLELAETLMELGLDAEALPHLERALELPSRVQREASLERAVRGGIRKQMQRIRGGG